MKTTYLDHAAATPLDNKVWAAMQSYAAVRFHNPSATYLAAKAASDDIAMARTRIAHWFGVRPAEIVFTSGGTEANNLAIHGIMQQFPEASIVTSAIEHQSVLEPAGRYAHKTVAVTPEGLIDLHDLERKIDDTTVLMSVMYANNEIGTIQHLALIAKLIKDIRHQRVLSGNKLPLYLHTDACQASNYLHLYVHKLGVDLMTINGGKIYGPKRAATLFVRSGVQLVPQIQGGGQERGMRSGTEDVMSIVGFAAALDIAQNTRETEARRLGDLQQKFQETLKQKLPNIQINGARHKLPNNVHVTFAGQDNERLMMALDEAGIQCAVGSACSASSDEPSHVLAAIGLSDSAARSSLRFTMGRSTKEADITRVVRTLQSLVS
jgi:cysteine desulfurase